MLSAKWGTELVRTDTMELQLIQLFIHFCTGILKTYIVTSGRIAHKIVLFTEKYDSNLRMLSINKHLHKKILDLKMFPNFLL